MALGRGWGEEKCSIPDPSQGLNGRGPPISTSWCLPLLLRPCELEPREARV